MGLDYSNYLVFCGIHQQKEFHQRLLDFLPELFREDGYISVGKTTRNDRIIVVGPPSRWVVIYDSDDPIMRLESRLSRLADVVGVDVSDEAWLALSLYRNEERADYFYSDPEFLLYHRKLHEPSTTAVESDFFGQPEKWKNFLLNPEDITVLREIWHPKAPCNDTLRKTAQLFGWNPVLCQRGYEVLSDGISYGFFWDSDYWTGGDGIDFSVFHPFYLDKVK